MVITHNISQTLLYGVMISLWCKYRRKAVRTFHTNADYINISCGPTEVHSTTNEVQLLTIIPLLQPTKKQRENHNKFVFEQCCDPIKCTKKNIYILLVILYAQHYIVATYKTQALPHSTQLYSGSTHLFPTTTITAWDLNGDYAEVHTLIHSKAHHVYVYIYYIVDCFQLIWIVFRKSKWCEHIWYTLICDIWDITIHLA